MMCSPLIERFNWSHDQVICLPPLPGWESTRQPQTSEPQPVSPNQWPQTSDPNQWAPTSEPQPVTPNQWAAVGGLLPSSAALWEKSEARLSLADIEISIIQTIIFEFENTMHLFIIFPPKK